MAAASGSDTLTTTAKRPNPTVRGQAMMAAASAVLRVAEGAASFGASKRSTRTWTGFSTTSGDTLLRGAAVSTETRGRESKANCTPIGNRGWKGVGAITRQRVGAQLIEPRARLLRGLRPALLIPPRG